jgi:hypothetical protein
MGRRTVAHSRGASDTAGGEHSPLQVLNPSLRDRPDPTGAGPGVSTSNDGEEGRDVGARLPGLRVGPGDPRSEPEASCLLRPMRHEVASTRCRTAADRAPPSGPRSPITRERAQVSLTHQEPKRPVVSIVASGSDRSCARGVGVGCPYQSPRQTLLPRGLPDGRSARSNPPAACSSLRFRPEHLGQRRGVPGPGPR